MVWLTFRQLECLVKRFRLQLLVVVLLYLQSIFLPTMHLIGACLVMKCFTLQYIIKSHNIDTRNSFSRSGWYVIPLNKIYCSTVSLYSLQYAYHLSIQASSGEWECCIMVAHVRKKFSSKSRDKCSLTFLELFSIGVSFE